VSPPPVQRRVPPAPAAQPSPPADAAPPVRSAAAPTSVAPAAVAPKAPPATSSFVVVLASQKSRMEALSLYADLQQQYGNLLGDKVPDVQEADLSSRNLGTVYRLVVGPPGPRDRALNLCNQLKAAGYQGCWVTSF
jgi:cell division septation protein DedD